MESLELKDDILSWLEGVYGAISTFYAALSEEQQIWFWLGACVAILIALATTILSLTYSISLLNNKLQSTSGWKPIRFYTMMWIGISIWMIIMALTLREEAAKGWTVLLAAGVISSIVFLWFLASKIGTMKTIGASATNALLGFVVSPIVVNLGILAIVVVVGLVALSLWAACQPQRVYVVNR
jgi:hypothetical protein